MQKGYFAVIPANVRYCKDIPDGAKLLYGEITALANENGYCWATNKYFAELYGKSIDTIGRWISELAQAGFILTLVDKQSGNNRKIWLSESPGCIGKNAGRVGTKMPVGYPQKCREATGKNAVSYKENNTMNNTKEEERATAAKISHLEAEKKKEIPPHVAPSPPSPAAFSRVNVEEEIARLRDDQAARDVFSMTRKIPASKYDDYLNAFALEVSATAEPHFSIPAFRKHFFNYAEKRYRIAKEQATRPSEAGQSNVPKNLRIL